MVKGRNHKARILSHICQGVLLNVGSLTKEGRNAFPQLSAGVSTCGAHKSSKKQAKNRPRPFQNVLWGALDLPKSRPGASKIAAGALKNGSLRACCF